MKPSSVLIPVVERDGETGLLFTERSKSMKHHAGQISFPGGRMEQGETSYGCALRETEEEIGVPKEEVTQLGQIDDVISPRGFHIQCHVGHLPDRELVLNPDEVEQTFWVPFSEIMDQSRHEVRPWKRIKAVEVHYFHFEACLVWGVTGRMLHCLRECLMVDPNARLERVGDQ